MGESKYFHVTSLGKLERLGGLKEVLDSRKAGGFIWIDFFDPKAEDLNPLMEPLGIHQLTIEDCLNDDQVPKMEDFPGNTFILMNAYTYFEHDLIIDEVDFILGKDFLVSVSGHNTEGRHSLNGLEERILRNLADVRKGSDSLLHVLMDVLVDRKFAAIEKLQDDLEDIEDQVIADPQKFHPSEIMRLRRCLIRLRKSLFHEREILTKICRRDCPYISEKAIFHFRDVYDHLAKSFEMSETFREMITSLMEMYVSLINNRMTMVANQTNSVMKRLTLITTIFMPLTLFAGIGGMSEWSMMTGAENWKITYPLFLVGMVIMAAANYALLKWLKWFE